MKEDIIAGIVGVVLFCAIVIPLLIFTGYIEWGEPTPTPIVTPTVTPTPSPTPSPTPPLNYDSSTVEKIDVDVDLRSLFGAYNCYNPTLSLSFYDKYDRKITKFNNGETNVIVVLEDVFKDSIWTKSTVIASGNEIPENIDAIVNIYERDEVIRDCYYLKVEVLLPDGRIANTKIYFEYDREINTKQYVDGYEDGKADARMGYSTQVSSSADKNYRDGYYDGYSGFTPVATSLDVGWHKTIKLS